MRSLRPRHCWVLAAVVALIVGGAPGAVADGLNRTGRGRSLTCARRSPTGARPSGLPAARRQLVPEPFGTVRLCRYDSRWLRRSVLLSAEEANRIAGGLNALKPMTDRQLDSFSTCFFADGPEPMIALVGYAAGPPLVVYVAVGCGTPGFSNGSLLRGDPEALRTRLIMELEHDTGGRI